MEKFVSVWSDGKTVPESYVFPPEQRPGDSIVPTSSDSIPIIDMGSDNSQLVRQIMQASEEYGSFQVINHGVPRRLMDEARGVFKEFFELPVEDKSIFCSTDEKRKCILFTSTPNYDNEAIHCWKDTLSIKCAPLEDCVPYWPEKPAKYRDVVAEFVMKVNEMGSRLMELICEGLGLEPKYLADALSLEQTLVVNHYPTCPDPRLTLGIGKHSDRSVVTILMQGVVPGLQIAKDGEWIGVETIPHAFVITMGNMAQVLSNGKLKNGDHRVVTSTKVDRQSAAFFFLPTADCFIEPAKPLVNGEHPPLYRGFKFQEYLVAHAEGRRTKNPDTLKSFRID